ncbi:MAG: hypothetical protein E2O53_06350 [Gammaproteobacteria bacterium]|nr:MAG: hypothetical protein E2O53_06350 [Gammaproteobacteria bacterium]
MRIARINCIILLALPGFPTYAQVMTTPVQDEAGVSEALLENADAEEVVAMDRAGDGEPANPDNADLSDEVDAASGSLDDSIGSIDAGRETRGWNFRGDFRAGYTYTDEDNRDASNQSVSEWRGRFRAGGTYSITEKLIVGGRLASTCSTDKCNPDIVFYSTLPNSSSIDDGDITFDQLYIHSFRREKFDVAIGRLQTKFVSRAGVFAKSLDRNDSGGTNVNWTDGVHGILHVNNDWTGHLILQRNQADGTGNIRRGPIDFEDDGARITYFLAAENERRFGPINQQGFDITYMPRSLMKDGSRDGRIKDYTGFVGRFAASWPEGSTGPRLNIAGEIGYAPETPTRAAVGLAGAGDTDGFAYLFSASLVEFQPDHSVGINYGRTDAGWLLSPQYRENEEAIEIRYMWRRSSNLAIDIRARWRKELEQLENVARKHKDLNVFARFTLGFGY